MYSVFAASAQSVNLKDLSPAKGIIDIGTLTNVIIRNAFVIAGVIALFLLIFGGFGFIMSAGSGDTKGIEKGQKAITAAIIGLILVALSASIVTLIGRLTGLQLLGQ